MVSIIENINDGKVVAIPTDTVYGLICDATNVDAIGKIYDIKGRDKSKPISIFVKDISAVYDYVEESSIDKRTYALMNEYWPGALTIIFKKKDGVLPYLNDGSSTIGIRIPSDPRLLSILNEIDIPLAQTSCNLSGDPPYMDSNEIKEKIPGMIDLIVDGNIKSNVASTVIDVSSGDIVVIRPGEVSEKEKL